MRLRKGRLGNGWTSWVRRLGTRGEPASWGPGVGTAWGVLLQRLCRTELELTLGPAEHWGDRLKARREPSPRPRPGPSLLPAWAQKGTDPSLCTRCGPLKLYLYSKRRCGNSAWVPAAPGAAASPPVPSLPTNRLKDSSRAQRNGRAPAREPLRLDPAILDLGTQGPAGEGGALERRMANRALSDWWSLGDPRARGEPRPWPPPSRGPLRTEHLWAGLRKGWGKTGSSQLQRRGAGEERRREGRDRTLRCKGSKALECLLGR